MPLGRYELVFFNQHVAEYDRLVKHSARCRFEDTPLRVESVGVGVTGEYKAVWSAAVGAVDAAAAHCVPPPVVWVDRIPPLPALPILSRAALPNAEQQAGMGRAPSSLLLLGCPTAVFNMLVGAFDRFEIGLLSAVAGNLDFNQPQRD